MSEQSPEIMMPEVVEESGRLYLTFSTGEYRFHSYPIKDNRVTALALSPAVRRAGEAFQDG